MSKPIVKTATEPEKVAIEDPATKIEAENMVNKAKSEPTEVQNQPGTMLT